MITDKRLFYKPFEYDQAHEFLKAQQRVHWLPEEVTLAADVNDFKLKLTESEKNLIGQILKSFAQTETHVEDYWSSYVSHWFPKPEIQSMAVTFGSFESIHAEAYSLLNESLGLDNFEAFMDDEEARNKIERLQQVNAGTMDEIAQSLAIFSAFTEGVNLFSSFAILMSFQMRNLMKGMGQIVAWSVRDESLHSKAGCWLFRQLFYKNKSK
jgi:ribonucleoside-diphosphate reductase beta chain